MIPFQSDLKTLWRQPLQKTCFVRKSVLMQKLDFAQIDDKFQRIVAQMAPFGPAQYGTRFVSHNVMYVGKPYVVGIKHLKLNIKQQNSAIFESIGFGLAEFENLLQPNQPFFCLLYG